MLVDDINFNLIALENIIRCHSKIDTSRVCERALSGRNAIDLVEANIHKNNYERCDFKLMLIDCQMPDIDGYEATEAIRDMLYKYQIPQPIIIAVTGHSEGEFVEKAINTGMNSLFSKPVKTDCIDWIIDLVGFPRDLEGVEEIDPVIE